jgi:ribonuclease HI
MKWYLLICDGGRRGGITYGSFIIYDDDGKEIEHRQFVIGPGTSNQAEYVSLIVALKWCLNNDVKNIVVMMDSLLVVNQLLDNWECKNTELRRLLKRVKKLQRKFEKFHIKHIYRKYVVQKLGH